MQPPYLSLFIFYLEFFVELVFVWVFFSMEYADAVCLGVLFGTLLVGTLCLIVSALSSNPVSAAVFSTSKKNSCARALNIIVSMRLVILCLIYKVLNQSKSIVARANQISFIPANEKTLYREREPITGLCIFQPTNDRFNEFKLILKCTVGFWKTNLSEKDWANIKICQIQFATRFLYCFIHF